MIHEQSLKHREQVGVADKTNGKIVLYVIILLGTVMYRSDCKRLMYVCTYVQSYGDKSMTHKKFLNLLSQPFQF